MDTHRAAPASDLSADRPWTGTVFAGVSLDGLIARVDDDITWLEARPPADHAAARPDPVVPGFEELLTRVDHLVMGRATFQKVLEIGAWPYDPIQVIVLSSSLAGPQPHDALIAPSLEAAVELLRERGARGVYWDGGATVQAALRAGLVDEVVVTVVPVLIGAGISLFGALPEDVALRLRGSAVLADGMVSTRYEIARS